MGALAAPFCAWRACLKASGLIGVLVLAIRWALEYRETVRSLVTIVLCSLLGGFGTVSLGMGVVVLLGMMSAK